MYQPRGGTGRNTLIGYHIEIHTDTHTSISISLQRQPYPNIWLSRHTYGCAPDPRSSHSLTNAGAGHMSSIGPPSPGVAAADDTDAADDDAAAIIESTTQRGSVFCQ